MIKTLVPKILYMLKWCQIGIKWKWNSNMATYLLKGHSNVYPTPPMSAPPSNYFLTHPIMTQPPTPPHPTTPWFMPPWPIPPYLSMIHPTLSWNTQPNLPWTHAIENKLTMTKLTTIQLHHGQPHHDPSPPPDPYHHDPSPNPTTSHLTYHNLSHPPWSNPPTMANATNLNLQTPSWPILPWPAQPSMIQLTHLNPPYPTITYYCHPTLPQYTLMNPPNPTPIHPTPPISKSAYSLV